MTLGEVPCRRRDRRADPGCSGLRGAGLAPGFGRRGRDFDRGPLVLSPRLFVTHTLRSLSVGPLCRTAPAYTRPPSTTRPPIAAAVSPATTMGSHQLAEPMAMRAGMAIGALIGSQEMARAQVVPGLPIAAKDTK